MSVDLESTPSKGARQEGEQVNSYAKAARSPTALSYQTLVDKGKKSVEKGASSSERAQTGCSSVDGELAGYIETGRKLTSDYLHPALGHISSPPVHDLGVQVGKLSISRNEFVRRVARLQEKGLVNTLDSNPSRDVMMEWVTANFFQDLKAKVTHLQVLAKFVFLVVLGKAEDRKQILEETPMYMRGKMILAFPWDPSFDHSCTCLGGFTDA